MSKLVKLTDTYAIDANLINRVELNIKEAIITVFIQGKSSIIPYIIELYGHHESSLLPTVNLLIDTINEGRN